MSGAGDRQEVSGDELRLLADCAGYAANDVAAIRNTVQDIVNGVDRRGWNAGAFDDQWASTSFGLNVLSEQLTADRGELLTRSREADLLNTRSFVASPAVIDSTPFANWSLDRKLEFALRRAIQHLPDALRRQLEAVLSPEAFAIMVGVLAVWAVGHAFGNGEAADVAVLAIAFATLGPEAWRLGGETGQFFTGLASAKTEADADAASKHLATAISILGVDGTLALITHAGRGVVKGPGPATDPVTTRVAVTPDGTTFKVAAPADGVLQMSTPEEVDSWAAN